MLPTLYEEEIAGVDRLCYSERAVRKLPTRLLRRR
jgi:hypothetical protein